MIKAPERATESLEVPGLPDLPDEPGLSEEQPFTSVLMTGISVFLSTSAAGWMAAGVFRGWGPEVVAILAALLGTAMVTLSMRSRRPDLIQYLVLPVAIAAGALLVLPDARGGTANLPSLVVEAITAGGIAQPPIPFDPGWRFILVVLTAALGAGALAISNAVGKPRLGMFIPVPLMFGAALVQPQDAGVVSSVIPLVLLAGSLAVSASADLRKEGAGSGRFELMRYVRGAIGSVALVVLLVIVSQLGILFPEQPKNQVIPPKRPDVQPLEADRVLFTVTSDSPGPWRLGVLDVYQQNAWMLPPYDLAKLAEIGGSGAVPEHPANSTRHTETTTTRFEVADIKGHVIPSVASPLVIKAPSVSMQFDPRAQTFRLTEERAQRGLSYEVTAPALPSGKDLASAPDPPESMKPFLATPIAPNEVLTLLNQVPITNSWDRLQFVRNEFYSKVVAAGAGSPVDVPPKRVAGMLQGQEATPYEITAAEVMLARWIGVPARVGYGFHKGDKQDSTSKVWEVHPKHGATWLEAYFHGHGWVPVIGVPPRAKASIDQKKENEDPNVRPSEQLSLVLYVPVKLQSFRLLYENLRFWLFASSPFLLALGVLLAFYTYPVKLVQRQRRRKWAASRGARARVMVAYANLRDLATDLSIGDRTDTPLNCVHSVQPDQEHTELAWLVTRAIWGDLRRDLRIEDVEAAEELALSVARRLRRAQPLLTRVGAAASRASLRSPYSLEVPTLWPSWATKGAIRSAIRRGLRKVVQRVRRSKRYLPVGSILLLIVLLLVSCGRAGGAVGSSDRSMPELIAPTELDGVTFQREPGVEKLFHEVPPGESLVEPVTVYTVRKEGEVFASLQVARFKPSFSAQRREVKDGVLETVGPGSFEVSRLGGDRVFIKRLPEQTMHLWFAPSGHYYQLLVARRDFPESTRLFSRLLKLQRGEVDTQVEAVLGPADPRRGEEG